MISLDKIDTISGSFELDMSRAKTALDYLSKNNINVPIRILGAGPDLERAIKLYKFFKQKDVDEKNFLRELGTLDSHLRLYNILTGALNRKVEVVTDPVTLAQDVFYGFMDVKNETHGIVTEPWHYKKFDYVQKRFKSKGIISKDIEFFNISSPSSIYEYGIFKKGLSWAKTISEVERIRFNY